MTNAASFYLTTPIFYVNGRPHIGHLYTCIIADFFKRYQDIKQPGSENILLTGTDEHGQKVQEAAQKNNKNTQDFVNELASSFEHLIQKANIDYNIFMRTTYNEHKEYVQEKWKDLEGKQEIYLGNYSGWYSTRDECFYSKDELVDGAAPTGAPVEWVEEESYFFKLSKWQNSLLEHYKQNPEFIQPKSRYNEVVSFVKSGLKDLSISRTSFSWGVEVPTNPTHVMYVWFDALFNYASAFQCKGHFKKPTEERWPCDLHIVGKDILRFHAVYWPAFLMAAGMQLPKTIFAHGWWTKDGEKMSKSIGNVIEPNELIDQYGLDYVRYFFLREITLGNDGDFSHQQFKDRINAELVNKIGNLSQRVISFIARKCDGSIEKPKEDDSQDAKQLKNLYESVDLMQDKVSKYDIKGYIEEIVKLADSANSYIDKNPPWVIVKEDISKAKQVLYVCAEYIRVIAILLQPAVPNSASKMLSNLNREGVCNWKDILNDKISISEKFSMPIAVFPRLS